MSARTALGPLPRDVRAPSASMHTTTVSRMKRSLPLPKGLLRVAAAAAVLLYSAAKADDKTIYVDLDYARVVRIPPGAQTLIIGNPLIADVTMLKNNQLMVVTGKAFGTTNLIVLDRAGTQVGESLITVVHPNDKLVVMRGPHRESYSCAPDCMPTVDLGDDHGYMNETTGAIKAHEGALTIGKH